MKIGDKIYELRKSYNISQEELAYRIGVSRRTLSLWENDERVPKADMLKKICVELKVDMSYFFPEENRLKENELRYFEKDRAMEIFRKVLIFGFLGILFLVAVAVMCVFIVVETAPADSNISISSITITPGQWAIIISSVIASAVALIIIYLIISQVRRSKRNKKR